jgi:hypothetical protein
MIEATLQHVRLILSLLSFFLFNCFLGPIRPVLRPSTSASIAYRVNTWFLTVITILLGPPILAALTYSSWLRPRLELSVFVANHAASLPFALTVLSAHGTLLCFVYGEFCLILNAVLQH